MAQNSRSNWNQETKTSSVTKDFYGAERYKAIAFAMVHTDPVQCIKCNRIAPKAECTKLPASRDHVCKLCR